MSFIIGCIIFYFLYSLLKGKGTNQSQQNNSDKLKNHNKLPASVDHNGDIKVVINYEDSNIHYAEQTKNQGIDMSGYYNDVDEEYNKDTDTNTNTLNSEEQFFYDVTIDEQIENSEPAPNLFNKIGDKWKKQKPKKSKSSKKPTKIVYQNFSEDSLITYFSEDGKQFIFTVEGEKFYKSMCSYQNRVEYDAEYIYFEQYFPTYGDMTPKQLKWFFYWRTKIREGVYPNTALSYIFVYIYELLCNVGTESNEDGLKKLSDVWNAYRTTYPKIDKYLLEWILDYCLIRNLSYNPTIYNSNIKIDKNVANKLLSTFENRHPLKLPFYLIQSLTDCTDATKKFYRDNKKLMISVIPRVIALVDIYLWNNENRGLFEKYAPQNATILSKKIYPSTILTNMQLNFVCKQYVGTEELRKIFTGITKHTENVLREIKGISGRVNNTEFVQTQPQLAKLIKKFLYKNYGNIDSVKTVKPEIQNKTISEVNPTTPSTFDLDFNRVDDLRKESNTVRNVLEVKEEEEKALLTDVKEVQLIMAHAPIQAVNLIYSLREMNWEADYTEDMDTLIDETNKLSIRYLARDIFILTGHNTVKIEEDFRDEVEYIWQSNHGTTCSNTENQETHQEIGDNTTQPKIKVASFDYNKLPDNLSSFVKSLTLSQKMVLITILTEEQPYQTIVTIADEAMSMPDMMIDEINEMAENCLGDLLLEQDGESITVIEEYEMYKNILKEAITTEE